MTWIERYCASTEKEERLGNCYELAFKGLCPEWPYVVQGYIHFKGGCIHHSWLESETEVFDPVMNLRTLRDSYYRLFQPDDDGMMLPASEARRMVLMLGHYGPWEEVDDSRIKLLPATD